MGLSGREAKQLMGLSARKAKELMGLSAHKISSHSITVVVFKPVYRHR